MGLERDRGWGAVQNCYPIAMEPLDMRNARDLTVWAAWGALVANEALGRPERKDPQASPG